MLRLLYLYGEEITGQRAREIHTLHRCHSLATAGAHVHLIIGNSPSFPSDQSLFDSFQLTPHPAWSITRLPRQWQLGPLHFTSSRFFYRNVRKFLPSLTSFDLAYSIHLKAAAFLQKEFPKLPVVFEAHELFADAHPPAASLFVTLERQEQDLYSSCQAVVATSSYLLQEIGKRHSLPKKTFISPNGVDESFFISNDRQNPHELLYAGSFQPWKGVPTALEAMRHLPEFHLTVIGGSNLQVRSLRRHAPSNVTFTGFLHREKIRPYLRNASIALIPNRLEPRNSLYTFPMKLLEYAAAGKRVVATDLPVLRELNPGPWLSRVPPDSPEPLAKAIRDLSVATVDPDAPRQWASHFRWNERARDLLNFLESLCPAS